MLEGPISTIKTRSPVAVFLVFALGIVLPGGFLSYLGLRSFQYEGLLMQKQTEEHFSASADLMQKKAGEECLALVEALRAIAHRDAFEKLSVPDILPILATPVKLTTIPVENLFVFDDQDHMLAPWPSDQAPSSQENVPRNLDWGPLQDEINRLESLEFAEKKVAEAVQGYAALQSPNLSPALQAALLKNMAGGYRKLHDSRQAEAAYLKLIRNYDQLRDFSGLPIGILGRQLLVKMYEDDKVPDRALDIRLDLYEGLILRRWAISPAQRLSMMAELRPLISGRGARAENLLAMDRALQKLEPIGETFAKTAWPDVVKRLRNHNWLDSGGVLLTKPAGSAGQQLIVAAPITAPFSERRGGLLVAILPADPLWPILDQSLTELARPVGLEVKWDMSHDFLKAGIERTVDRIDPPLHFHLLDTQADLHNQLSARRRWIYGGMVGLSFVVIIVGLALMGKAMQREMEVANLKADFVATVSHELRTPLAAISHIGERLSLGRYRTEEERQEFYGLLGKETHRLRGLIEDILDFSKMLAGRKVYRREPLHAVTLVQEAVESFEGKAEARGFQIALQLPAEDLVIEGDRRALLQAILNLMDNAMKYSGESRKIEVRVEQSDGRCRIGVQDHGIGIPESEKEKIFEKFYRVENAMSHASESGVGLGLAMVKHVVDGHDGVIQVDSRVGKGSTFIMEFPLSKKV